MARGGKGWASAVREGFGQRLSTGRCRSDHNTREIKRAGLAEGPVAARPAGPPRGLESEPCHPGGGLPAPDLAGSRPGGLVVRNPSASEEMWV